MLEKSHDPFRKLDLLLELIPFKYPFGGGKEKSVTKDIISIRINGKNNHFRHGQNLCVRKEHEYFQLGSQTSLVLLPQNVHQSLQQPVISVLVGFGVIENIDIVVIQTVLGVFKVGRFVQLFQGFVEIFVRDVGLCTWRLLW